MKEAKNIVSARKIKKNYRSVTGIFPSKKNNRSIPFESLLERDFYLSLEFDPRVQSYHEQPIKIVFETPSRKKSYHPDVLVYYIDGLSAIFEVKYSKDLEKNHELYAEKFEAASIYATEHNMVFSLFTEQNLNPVSHQTMDLIYNFAFIDLPETMVQEILTPFEHHTSLTFDSLKDALKIDTIEKAKITPYIFKMIFDKKIEIVDMSKPFNGTTLLRLHA